MLLLLLEMPLSGWLGIGVSVVILSWAGWMYFHPKKKQ